MKQPLYDNISYTVIQQKGKFYSFLIDEYGMKDILGEHDKWEDAIKQCEEAINKLFEDD